MIVIAVDPGEARAGAAICDLSGTIVRPLEVIEPPEPDAVARLAAEHAAELIVVGLPVSLNGDEGPQAQVARRFAAGVAARVTIPVEMYDERLTTRLAESSARSGAAAAPDSLAAAHLLESFLQAREAPHG